MNSSGDFHFVDPRPNLPPVLVALADVKIADVSALAMPKSETLAFQLAEIRTLSDFRSAMTI